MSNKRFDIAHDKKEILDLAMKIAFADHKSASHYRLSVESGLVLFWGTPSKDNLPKLLYPLNAGTAAEYVWNWLLSLDEKEFGPQPDHDGDNKRGWRVYNEAHGIVDRHDYAFVAIKPVWIIYGK